MKTWQLAAICGSAFLGPHIPAYVAVPYGVWLLCVAAVLWAFRSRNK